MRIAPIKLNKNKVSNIRSIICSKRSRLDELEEKEYIAKHNNLWRLTIKGACVALAQVDSIMEVYPLLKVDVILDIVQRDFHKHPIIKVLLESFTLKQEDIDESFAFGKFPKLLQLFKDYTNELIRQGVDLDKMTNSEFTLSMIVRGISYFMESLTSELTEVLSEKTAPSVNRND